jgi:hypothetical protein
MSNENMRGKFLIFGKAHQKAPKTSLKQSHENQEIKPGNKEIMACGSPI